MTGTEQHATPGNGSTLTTVVATIALCTSCSRAKNVLSCKIPASLPKNESAESRFCICMVNFEYANDRNML